MTDREELGRRVREIWVAWASEQPDPKPSWLASWDDLDDGQREADMRIGEGVAAAERERLAAVISPALFRRLADWFDADDEFKEAMFPQTWSPGSRPDEVQKDLRTFADLLAGDS
ncbi:MAG TPA: hypothetical protein VIZ43_08430 [Trebonia sp.]